MTDDEKTLLALQAVEGYSDLERVLGYQRASSEMAHLLGEYVLRGSLNEFEADLIATLAILGSVANHVMDENERLRNDVRY